MNLIGAEVYFYPIITSVTAFFCMLLVGKHYKDGCGSEKTQTRRIVDALLVCEEDDSDLDMLLTDTFSTGRNLENTPVNLDQFSDDECFEFFRFAKPDLTRLHDGLSLPEKIVGYNGTAATSMEALLILLRRLAYPNRWCDLVTFFQRDEPELSIIFNTIVEHIYEECGHL
ncbi:uncharacterized protein [Ptychodera flava]|uniref:uncharacterized protein n=1 Tax=Ptychodera flava TaxID=63121 RepID=UPI00396A1124